MTLNACLLTDENLALVKKQCWQRGRPLLIEQGLRYYDSHPKDVARIVDNLRYMDLPHTGEALDAVLRQIIAHYYEKVFALTKRYEAVWVARNRVEIGDSLTPLHEATRAGKAVFVAECHFGGTYLLPAVFMVHGIELHMVGRFPPKVASLFCDNIRAIVERYHSSPIHLLNLLDPGADIPLRMLTLLLQKKQVSNVFDEPNELSRTIELLGRPLRGGSGMDRLLRRFSDDQVCVVTPFLIRTSDEHFRLEVDCHSLDRGDIVTSWYRSLEQRLRHHFEQWYFIHELQEARPDLEHAPARRRPAFESREGSSDRVG